MRNLKTSDLFALGRCITKIGIKEDLKEIGLKANSIKDINEKGFEVIFTLFEKVCAEGAEKPIYEFVSTLLECKWGEVRDMNPIDLIEKIKEVADWKQWKAFFKMAVR